mgnify:CR=1 FL=1
MSLLLDALKGAEENRKTVEKPAEQSAEGPKITTVSDDELEWTLELEHESDEKQSVNIEGSNSTEEKIKESSVDESNAHNVVISKETSASSIELSNADHQINTEIGNTENNSAHDSNIDNVYAAEAVFRNRNRGRSLFLKASLLLGLVCVLVFVAGYYYWFLKSQDSINIRDLRSSNDFETKTEQIINSPSSDAAIDNMRAPKKEELGSAIDEGKEIKRSSNSDGEQINKEVDKLSEVTAIKHIVKGDTSAVGSDKKSVKEGENDLQRDMSVVSNRISTKESSDSEIRPLDQNKSLSAVNIRKRNIPNQTKIDLNKGKQAIVEGKWGLAESIFRKVLAESPKNIEALIYMADIMNVQGKKEIASALYFDALEKSPGNLKASVGLLGLTEDKISLKYGSTLKQLVIDNPSQAFLQANLGDYYIGRGEWPEAQAAYFEAFAKHPRNANYAFNLAVCLDQLGKSEIALRYYQQALALNKSSVSRFDEKSALARVQLLIGVIR